MSNSWAWLDFFNHTPASTDFQSIPKYINAKNLNFCSLKLERFSDLLIEKTNI